MTEGTRVLLVDDDPAMLRLLEVNFRLEGFVVESASRGDEAARDRARPRRPTRLLLDVMMPGMDGHQVAARLRALPGLAEVPVVFLSARVLEEDEPQEPRSGP